MLGEKTLGLIGAGNMGEALLRGVLHGDLLPRSRVFASARRQERLDELARRLDIETTADNSALVGRSDILILAVKPQDAEATLLPLRPFFRPGQLLLSIAAGVSTLRLEGLVGQALPIVRSMPNTPALVGQGASAYCRGRHATAEHALVAQMILDSVGVAVEVPEELLDGVTAVSGTGPAYIYFLMEAMIEAATHVGLPLELSKRLVKQTLLGAARLVMDSGEEPGRLRARVTSKGGTTAAAIATLEKGDYFGLMREAIGAACRRSAELGKEPGTRTEEKSR